MRTKIFVILIIFLLLAGCNFKTVETHDEGMIVPLAELQNKAAQILEVNSPTQIQQYINKLAPILAKALNHDKSLKKLLGEEIGKKFDGDYDVLYDMVSFKTSENGNSLKNALKLFGGSEVDNIVNSIPYFNICIPVNLITLTVQKICIGSL